VFDPEVLLADPAAVRKLGAVAAWKAARARKSLPDFFEFVMVHETLRTPLKVAPHQRVFLDFMMKHDRTVNMLPIGHSKTFCTAAISLMMLGEDPTTRGAIVSSTQGQAAKPLGMVASYIETSARLKLVYPHLRKMPKGGKWTETAITVDRPPGIRDPSLVAVGVDGAIAGARLNWIVVDDILSRQNTASKDQRDKVYEWFDTSVLSRLDPTNARVVVTNTAWHPDDLVHRLRDLGWPTIRMDMLGDIELFNTDFDSDELRPRSADPHDYLCRLAQHDPDPENDVMLWPEVRGPEYLEWARANHLPHQFNKLFRNITRDDKTARCQLDWIEKCKRNARDAGWLTMVANYTGSNPTFTGVDLAVKEGDERDETAFFTFEVLPSGRRRILDIEIAQMQGPLIVKKILEKTSRYNSVAIVEDNGAQAFIKQFTLDIDASTSIRAHYTGGNKMDPQFGVESLFIELANGAWEIPNRNGVCHPAVQRFIDACLYYQPSKHTDDVLMAAWFAKDQARKWGLTPGYQGSGQQLPIGASITAR